MTQKANPIQELENLSDFLREAMNNPDTPISRADMVAIYESMMNRPVMDGEFPDVELFNLLVSRMLANTDRLDQLKRSPFEPIVALLPYISQTATSYKDWLEQKKANKAA